MRDLLMLRAYHKLVEFELYVARADFPSLYQRVRNQPVCRRNPQFEIAGRICAAVDVACIWYWKQVLCLQRSAATTCLLRQFGLPAQMVIGAKQLPFRAHAWVEIEGHIVNDKPYIANIYAVLDRC